MMEKKFKAAIAGCGGISSVHVETLNLLSDVEIIGVCDPESDKTHAASQVRTSTRKDRVV